ncbi:hypothetical protein FHR24_003136 [Wenyingzhuangia heitensis]|uniref:6-bladed beta-propeller protein n=1 Tax=Wenyingzhuangia heitensis TaxID=1487859 RepID=A0ABX0UGI2_9FLAO|nr:6-bladed beta-propeller [Wenyingzhuangia heitensis]NIJ46641.1 hypothetical protein [Wenyingzhuangia heitensis]
MKFQYLLILLIGLLVGCKKETSKYKGLSYKDYISSDFNSFMVDKKKGEKIIIPEISDYDKPITISNILDTCFTVSLESNSKNLIGRIDEVKVVDNYIFVLDSRKSKGVFMFDLEGKYIRRIGELGRGPGEYPFPGDMAINEKRKQIFIFNGNTRKVYKYNFNGEFLGDITLDIGGYSIDLNEKGNLILFCQGYSNNHLGEIKNKVFYEIDEKGNILSFGPSLSTDYHKVKMTIGNRISVRNQYISYSNKFSDTIYKLQNNKVNIQYVLDFGENILDREKLKSLKTNAFLKEIRDVKLMPNYRGIHYQTYNYLYFNFYYGNTIVNCYYNKNESMLYASKIIAFQNADCLYSYVPIATYNDYFISSLDAYNIVETKDYFLNEKNLEWIKRSKKTINRLNMLKIKNTDNPVLIFYKLK